MHGSPYWDSRAVVPSVYPNAEDQRRNKMKKDKKPLILRMCLFCVLIRDEYS